MLLSVLFNLKDLVLLSFTHAEVLEVLEASAHEMLNSRYDRLKELDFRDALSRQESSLFPLLSNLIYDRENPFISIKVITYLLFIHRSSEKPGYETIFSLHSLRLLVSVWVDRHKLRRVIAFSVLSILVFVEV